MLMRPYRFAAAGDTGYIVDDYSVLLAYSLRKLSSTATNALRVRRSSDSTEQDIGFSGDDFDVSSIQSFCSGTDGFVVKWYNQGTGGATYDAAQTTAADQPQIVTGGTAYDGIRNVSNDFFTLGANVNTTQLFYSTSVFDRATTSSNVIAFSDASTNAYPFRVTGTDLVRVHMGGTVQTVDTKNESGLHTSTTLRDSSDDIKQWWDGTASTPVNQSGGSTDFDRIGKLGASSYSSANVELQELIFHDGDLESDRADIMTNVNTYYSIY